MYPILFKFDSFTIYTYGFFVAIAVLISLVLVNRRAKALGMDPGLAGDLVFFLFISGVLGARAFYVFQHIEDYSGAWWKIFSIAEGGLVWYGGFLTAASLGIGLAAWRRWSILKFCDLFAPVLPLAHAIGRVGCFFNGCCYGRETNLPWGVLRFSGENFPRIPVQLIEAAALLFLSVFLFKISEKKLKEGKLFILYLILYSAIRFFIEFLRGDQTPIYYLTLPQWTSALLFFGTLFLFYRKDPGVKKDRKV